MVLRNVHQKPNPKILFDFLQNNYPRAKYKVAYEAGKFGFGFLLPLDG
jgi:transposase